MKTLPLNTFRQYDIRGIADVEFTNEFVYHLGRAFATLMRQEKKTRVSVGYDMRPSSDRIQRELIRGLMDGGLSVTNLGMLPTPLLYFSVSHLKLDAGICITGSHNPIEYNGFKIHLQDRPFYGEEIQNLRQCMESENYQTGVGSCVSKILNRLTWNM
jgi:phosphomannomutase